MVWLVNERAFLAVFDTRLWFPGTVTVGRMEETRKPAFRATYFGSSCERVSFQVNIAVVVYCSFRLDFLCIGSFSGRTWGIVSIVEICLRGFLLDNDCCRCSSCYLLFAVGLENYVVDYIIEDII
jgi:hypothetical protein